MAAGCEEVVTWKLPWAKNASATLRSHTSFQIQT